MNRPKILFATLLVVSTIFVSAAAAQTEAQPAAGPSYEVVLQVLLGSNESGGGELPKNLASVTRQLKNSFAFSNYRLANTYLGRMAITGNLEYKSVIDFTPVATPTETPTFLDWRVGRLRNSPGVNGRTAFNVEAFRFGARVPIKATNYRDETGKNPILINYEPIGLNLDKLSLVENTPSLIGTLSLPQTSGTMFLVLTVRQAEN